MITLNISLLLNCWLGERKGTRPAKICTTISRGLCLEIDLWRTQLNLESAENRRVEQLPNVVL